MKITPIEIRKYEFKKTFRGYDPDEVRYFLEMMADEMEALNREKISLEQKVQQYDEQLNEYRQIEKSMQNALIVAKETSDKSLANTKKESKLIIADAEARADRIVEQARKEASKIQQEITRLKIQRDTFIVKIKNLLRSELELLEAMDEVEDIDEMDFDEIEDDEEFDAENMKKEMRELDEELYKDIDEEDIEDLDDDEVDITIDDEGRP
ncbi:MAG: DivIVA domain-containing protein [Candidatus Marinimicrobia bacterium]|nr:DivIVA domain-containing protein [Candidatus Neomarinimicrobiota bacterium]MCF7829134.1 DivIVA domain-containing protein [Candidatus Neomarinimicrobiota bacterium]MCF7881467.1 DivIVA domain-containing protein [Candidatus Neomarinimicrobiota bacterium]